MKKCVDRLTILDGVVVAAGWCEGGNPEVVIGDQALDQQLCVRMSRLDVEEFLGSGPDMQHGFRICGVTIGLHDYSKLGVRFPDGEVLRTGPPCPEDRANDVLLRFMEDVKSAPADASLIELGSRARSGNSYRSLFPTVSHYTGVDIIEGENVDVVADLHLLSEHVTKRHDFAFSMSVFEHLLMPWVVVCELNKVLVEGGLAYIQSHPAWSLHDEPWDFFRYSKDAWYGLFNTFTGFELLDTAYTLEASIVPLQADSGSLQGIDTQRTFLATCCLAKKVSEPKVDWRCDPSPMYRQEYPF